MNVLRYRAKFSPTYCGDIRPLYTRAVLSRTTDTDFNMRTWFGWYEISLNSTSLLSFGPSSMGCGNSTVNAPIVLSGYRVRGVTEQHHVKVLWNFVVHLWRNTRGPFNRSLSNNLFNEPDIIECRVWFARPIFCLSCIMTSRDVERVSSSW